ncbi:MAG TPA: molybdenum cofactor guanylyltransferase [Chitinophagaceae bacterium]|nr:molybdenum cofactor guanylyltransferase [Chitinophagaceae bacterium]
MEKFKHIDAFVLAGGKSSRMGTDKGLLLFKNKHLVEWAIDELQLIFDKVIIVSNKQVYKKFKLEVIKDVKKNLGPAGGIYSILKHTKTNYVVVVSCDMPFINSNAIAFLINQCNDYDITIPVYKNKLQPLCAVYSKNCLVKWKELIDKNEIKLQNMIEHFNVLKINVDDNSLFNESQFVNINDRNDFENAFQLLKYAN